MTRPYKTLDKRRGTGVVAGSKSELRRLVAYVTPEVYERVALAARAEEISNSAFAAKLVEKWAGAVS